MTQAEILLYFVFPGAGFLLGSIPFAWVIGKFNGVDIRTTGSKNVGATNLGRTMGQIKGPGHGKNYFFGAFLLDALKGFLPTLLAALYLRYLQIPREIAGHNDYNPEFWAGSVINSAAPLLTAMAAVLGHLFPPWLKFRGGKGVATSFGVVLGIWPLYTLAGLGGGIVFVVMLMIYRYISLASITAALAFVGLVAWLGLGGLSPIGLPRNDWSELGPLLIVAGLFALFIIIRHRTNIVRLMKGTEPRVGQREVDKSRM